MVQSLICNWALSLVVRECAKLHKAKEQNSNLSLCNCTIKQSMGLPCYHTVHERLSNGGYILPIDIHPFWWYKRPELHTSSTMNTQTRRLILNPAVVRGKGRPRGSKNKQKGHGITSTWRDPSQFEHIPSSLAPAVLSRPTHQLVESAAVMGLIAQENDERNKQDNSEDEGGEFIDIIDPQLRDLTTTQMGLLRIEESSDTYYPGTLVPRLYQTNPFSRGLDDEQTGMIIHELTAQEVVPTVEEIQAIANEEEDEQALSQAIDSFVATTRAGRTAKASGKVVLNRKQEKEEQAKASGWRRGRGGRRGGRRGGGRVSRQG